MHVNRKDIHVIYKCINMMSCNWLASRPPAKKFDISHKISNVTSSLIKHVMWIQIYHQPLARFLKVNSWCFMPISFHKNIHVFWHPLIFFLRLQSFKLWILLCSYLNLPKFAQTMNLGQPVTNAPKFGPYLWGARTFLVSLCAVLSSTSKGLTSNCKSCIMCSWEPSLCHCGYTCFPPKQVKRDPYQ